MLKRTLFVIALAAPALGHGAVYQCKVNGQTVFSDQPCGDSAKKIEIRSAPKIGGSMGGDSASEFLEYRDKKRQVQLIDREIDQLKEKRERVKGYMNDAIIQYQRDKARANNNLAGAVWENSLAEEAQVMRERYQSEIDDINREIDRLYKDREAVK